MSELNLQEFHEIFPNGVRVIHTICGGVAFFYSELPQSQTLVLDPRKAMTLKGNRVKDGDMVVCGHCGNPVGTNHMEFAIEKGDIFVNDSNVIH